MFNSTIQDRIDFCIECTDGIKKPLIAGRCKAFHYPRYRKQIAYQKANQRQKEIVQSDKHKLNIEQDLDLENWFDMVAGEIRKHPYCMECGSFIPQQFYRHASAHILAKKIFPSVATNPNNFLILGASCGCHHRFDNGAMQEMNVFEEAVRRFAIFAPLVKEKHKILHTFSEYIISPLKSSAYPPNIIKTI